MTEFLETTVDKFTFRVASDRLYSDEGVWAKLEGDLVRVGISDFVQQHSGDVAFAQIIPVGTEIKTGDEIGTIETIKVNISIESPLAGKIVEVNPAMESTPETINQDPYGEGWLVLIEPYDWETDRTCLMDARAYFEHMKKLAENEARK